jgi:eukaryotic-like serine/threonine-protein kinase
MNEGDRDEGTSSDPTTKSLAAEAGDELQFRPGERLSNRFVIVQFLARGGMGEVYEVIDEHLQGKHLALKTLRPEIAADARMRARFEREVLLAREINHRNVCPTYDLFHLDGPRGPLLCLTMKLLRGESLSARLRRLGSLSPEAALPIAHQLAAGLDAAHAAGVIHRDFKPGNVIIERSGSDPQAAITDFGLSRFYDSDHTIGRIGQIAGTPGYIAPEVFEGRTASPASDVYAFGVLLHEMLTGHPPANKPGSKELLRPSSFRPELPSVWDPVILGCLDPDPAKRFQSAGEAMELLDTPSSRGRQAMFRRSRSVRLWIASGVAALIGTIIFSAPRLDNLLHPLPPRRYVALMAAPGRQNPTDAALLNNVIDDMSDSLVRAESYVKDLLIIAPRDLGAQQKLNKPEEAMTALGANLVLIAGFNGSSRILTLQLMDPASRKVLRQATLRMAPADLARTGEEATMAAIRLLGLPQRPRQWKDQDELAGLSASTYQVFAAAEELRKQPNDIGLDQAIEKYQQVLEANTHFALGYAKLALAYVRKYQLAHDGAAIAIAEKNAQLAAERNPDSPTAVLSQALVYLYSGRTAQALDSLARALKLDPGNPEVLFYEAVAYRNLNRASDEEKTYRSIIEQRPNFFRAYNELGWSLYRQGHYAESATVFQEAAQVAPRQALPLTNLGTMYLLLGRKQEAIAAFRSSLDRGPSELAYLNLGNISFEQGEYRKALEFYQKAGELKPSEDGAWRNVADCFSVLGDHNKMLENYDKAAGVLSERLKINPNNGPGWMTLAFYQAKLGRRAETEDDLKRAETAGAADLQSQFTKAQALAVLGRKEEAIKILVSCVRRGLSPVEVQLALDLKEIRSDPRYLRQAPTPQPETTPEK